MAPTPRPEQWAQQQTTTSGKQWRSAGKLAPSPAHLARSTVSGGPVVATAPTVLLLLLVAHHLDATSITLSQQQVAPLNGIIQHQQQISSNQIKASATMGPSGATTASNLPKLPSNREIEKQIVDRILGEGYDKRIRPAGPGPRNNTQPGKCGAGI